MGNDGETPALKFGKRKNATHGCEFFARETAHDTGLAEQSLDGRIARCYRTSMRRCGATATLARTCLDGRYATTLTDKIAGVKQQFVGVGYILDIEQFCD